MGSASRSFASLKSSREPNETSRLLPQKAVEFERLERQAGDLGDERALFALVEKVRTMAEPVRQTGFGLEQAQLVGHRVRLALCG